MCGIAGILSLSEEGRADPEPLDRMVEAMCLRGLMRPLTEEILAAGLNQMP
jgi:hypothetical protein